ncbi:MAG TPA: DsbA family protein [Vicinamibacterales bacterium]|nr:DsbA family protein [Vicinamibacterales bacterium]
MARIARTDRLRRSVRNSYGLLSDIAAEVGLDATAFETCRADPATAEAVSRDVDLAASFGIGSTPTFFINQRQVIGAQPLDYFVAFIEAGLRDAGTTSR